MNKYLFFTYLFFIYSYYYYSNNYLISSFLIFILIFYKLLKGYGNSINLINLIELHSSIVYLIAPTLGYIYYDENNVISKIWVAFMPVPSNEYFGYIIPALISFYLGIELFYSKKLESKIKIVFSKLHEKLFDKKQVSYLLLLSGFVSYYLSLIVPQFLSFIFYIIFLFIFPGIFYLFFNPNKNKIDLVAILFIVGWIFLAAIRSTMFTIIMYMGITVSGLLLYNLRYSFLQKLIISFLSIYIILTVQYTKMELRKFREDEDTSISVSKFVKTFFGNTTILARNFDYNMLFPIYIRINQGKLTGNVLRNIPRYKSIDNGKRLFTTIISSFVPRLFWPDKPMAGGRFNMLYYGNVQLDKASMNVGPIGEAYGSFGFYNSFVYLFIFGAFISWSIRLFLKICLDIPLLILWLPVLFFQTVYCSETDSLQVFNSLFKTAFLLFIIFKIFPSVVGLSKNYISKGIES